MRDISCAGYVAGGNCDWFAKNKATGVFSADTAKRAIQNRLSFADDVSARYPSMLAFPLPASQWEDGEIDTVMSVTSRLLPWEVSVNGGGGDGNHASFPGGQVAYNQYKTALDLGQVHYGEDMKAAENMEFISQGSTNNALCFMGPHRKYNAFSKSAFELVPGQGHFGPDAIPGDARYARCLLSPHYLPHYLLRPILPLPTAHSTPQLPTPNGQVAPRRSRQLEVGS